MRLINYMYIIFYFSRVVRKFIVRVLIVMYQIQKENLRKYYKFKRLKFIDFRKKKIRVMRRVLIFFEKFIKLRKQQRRERFYFMRKFVVK